MNLRPDPVLDIDFVRQQFPAFSVPALQGQALFENAGGSYACGPVIDRLTRYYREFKVQPYYAYPASQAAGAQMDESYARLAPWLGVAEDEVFFGPSTTQNAAVLAQAALGFLRPGDEVIVTNQDHEANSGAWRRLEERGMRIREWQVDTASGTLHGEALARLLNERTALVAFPHCSNILGEVNPVAQWTSMVRDAGAISIVDGVSFAGHGLPDVRALGADVYFFSLYKTYGPHLGVMTIRSEVAARFANQSHYFNADVRTKRLLPAGPDHAQIAATQGIVDYFDALHDQHFADATDGRTRRQRVADLFAAAERINLDTLLAFLGTRKDVRVLGPTTATGRAPTVALIARGVAPGELLTRLAARGIMSGAGHFYSPRLLAALGIDSDRGVNRLSFVHYTSAGDMRQLLDALEQSLS